MLTSKARIGALVGACLLLLAAAGADAILTAPAAGAAVDARLTIFIGSVQVAPGGDAVATAAHSGQQLRVGDVVATGPNTKAAIAWPDDGETRLDYGTAVVILGLARDAAGVHASIRQESGRTWTQLPRPAAGSTLHLEGPGDESVDARSAEFAVFARSGELDTGLTVDTFRGTLAVSAGGRTLTSTARTHALLAPDRPPLVESTIPAAALGDPWTVFNRAADENSVIQGAAAPGATAAIRSFGPAAVGTGRLEEGEASSVQPGVTVTVAAGVAFSIDWPGSTFTLCVIEPDAARQLCRTSSAHPFSILIRRARPGTWQYTVADAESGGQAESWFVVVSTLAPASSPGPAAEARTSRRASA